MQSKFANIATLRRGILIAFTVLFIFIGGVIIYQYVQFLHIEKRLNNTYQRLSPINSFMANTLFLEFNKAETAFRLYTLTFDNKAYQEYARQIRIVKKIADSLSIPQSGNGHFKTSFSKLQEKDKLSIEYANLKKNMDELILYSQDTIPHFTPPPIIVPRNIIPKKVLHDVVAEKTITKVDTVVKKKRSLFKRLFEPASDTMFYTYHEKQQLTKEQVQVLNKNVDKVIANANQTNQQQINKVKDQLLRVRKKERQLITINYALLNSYKAGLESLRDAELTRQRTIEKKDFANYKKNTDIFSKQLVAALSLMFLMVLALNYYQEYTKRTEQRLKKEKEYVRAIAQEKTAILANISHEIRTPLNSVFGVIEMLRFGEDEKKLDKNLIQSAYYSIKVVTNMVNDILSLGKLEAGQDKIAVALFSPISVLQDSLDTFQHLAILKEINLHLNSSLSSDLLIESNELRIRQIVTNLLSNAIKFTKKGTVILHASLEHTKSGHHLKIAVEDEGSGMDQDTQKNIFRKYFSADAQTAVSGTGLGLYLVKLLVKQLSGTITFKSELAKGSTFYVSIPVSSIKETYAASINPEPKDLPKNLDCLVVDDNPINILYLKHFMSGKVRSVETAADGYEALDKLAVDKFNLVLTDLSMPGMSGIDLLAAIRTNPNYQELPVLAISADTSMIDRLNQDLPYHFDGLIVKPFKEAEFISAILNALKRKILS
ncbi:Signal transduction histidine kinase [bacterium A37T11]|nr:Signal transduction histidine kinase [bacterium A37T11]